MKLLNIRVENQPPLKLFDVSGLSSVVVIAGPNGVGKTRLLNAVLQALRDPRSASARRSRIAVSATHDAEREAWSAEQLDTDDRVQADKLASMLQRQQKRGHWQSNVLHFDSSRQFAQVSGFQWQWNFPDPSDEVMGWDLAFDPFQHRFQDTIHAIYRMLGHHRAEIARKAIELQRSGQTAMPLDFPDPLQRFREAFGLLLGPKQLADIDISNPQIRYIQDGATLDISNLSSGEKEAFNIVFDLLLRQPNDCIIFFDEPELHLHPELSFRLLKTLQVIGARNQFVLFTHSADIISSAMEHSVVFVTPHAGQVRNQAYSVKSADDTVSALRQLGQSLGVISLGRRIVLIEGADASVDRDTYGAIAQSQFPSLVLVPSGSRGTMLLFNQVVSDVLSKTVWGIDFFMLADRDNSLPENYLTELEERSAGRLRFLPRVHIENYFLDEATIAVAFADLVPRGDWRRDPVAIRERLHALARAAIPIAVNRWIGTHLRALVGDIDLSIKGCDRMSRDEMATAAEQAASTELGRIARCLDVGTVRSQVAARWQSLVTSLSDGEAWKVVFPGKVLFNQFANASEMKPGMVRSAYLAAARKSGHAAFQDVIDILRTWA